MILSLLAGLIIGFVMAMPPGPVAVTALKLGLEKGAKHGYQVGLGTGLIDFFYCMIAVFATSAALALLGDFTDKYPLLTLIIQLSVVAGMMIYGFITLKSHKNPIVDQTNNLPKKVKFFDKLAHRGSFFFGLAVALANIANPTFMPSLAYVSLNVQKLGLIELTTIGNISYALGFGVGNFLWIYFLIRILTHYRSKLSDKFIVIIKKFAGYTLIGFGSILGYRVLEITKWSEVLRFVFAL
ncbi:MAG: LysE family transporter [Candidatus Kapabacteria bacterium]|nr:LysE family transporter [Candidatus Kapabacteria bacterium]